MISELANRRFAVKIRIAMIAILILSAKRRFASSEMPAMECRRPARVLPQKQGSRNTTMINNAHHGDPEAQLLVQPHHRPPQVLGGVMICGPRYVYHPVLVFERPALRAKN